MDPDSIIGSVLHDTHRIVRLVGQGGMGAVYEAVHVRLSNKRFAIKVLHVQAMAEKGLYARFRREAKIATNLGHPNIVEVTDFYETHNGLPCMVMELLRGQDLEEVLSRRGALHPVEVREIVVQVGSALQAAHEQGVVHRDLKPANIHLGGTVDGGIIVKLLDFGISKIRDSNTKLTGNKDILGTPHYMSPEQGSGDVADVDQTTDIFALGIICYQALTGALPFDAPTMLGVLYKICNDEPPPPSTLVAGATARLDAVLLKALSKDRAQRHQSVSQFVDELRPALEEIDCPPSSRPLADSLAISAGEQEDAPLPPGLDIGLAPTVDPADIGEDAASFGESATSPDPAAPGWRKQLVVAVILAPVLVAGLVFWTTRDEVDSSAKGSAAPPVATARSRPDLGAAAASTGNLDAKPGTADAAARVRITLTLTPPTARVLLDGESRTDNPLILERGETPRKLQVEAKGFRAQQREIVALASKTISISLEAAKPSISAGQRRAVSRRKAATSARRSRTGGQAPGIARVGDKGAAPEKAPEQKPPEKKAPAKKDQDGSDGFDKL